MRIFQPKMFLFSLLIALFPITVNADPVTKSIEEALESYKSGKHSKAINSLSIATRQIQQLKGKGLEALLPDPLTGWTINSMRSSASPTNIPGGGVSAIRKYSKKEHGQVYVQIFADSPVIQSAMAMYSAPVSKTSKNKKLEEINGEKAIIRYDRGTTSGEIKIMIADRYLITIEGEFLTRKELKDYAQAIDYKAIAALP